MPTIAERERALPIVSASLIEDMKLIYNHVAMTKPPRLYGTPNEKYEDMVALRDYHIALVCEFVAAKTEHEAKKKPAETTTLPIQSATPPTLNQ